MLQIFIFKKQSYLVQRQIWVINLLPTYIHREDDYGFGYITKLTKNKNQLLTTTTKVAFINFATQIGLFLSGFSDIKIR
jgi:hypothetical protein